MVLHSSGLQENEEHIILKYLSRRFPFTSEHFKVQTDRNTFHVINNFGSYLYRVRPKFHRNY